ncbi:hypothetical protein [Corynebacterium pseudopelargi]|uniref:Uncharacterized protein n=1 Tax=Corynebacterium pseudopelargi TaxID=2080757 RepID=A0A3G6IV64_9CORY|nr:hypothetical protein [Corynebacterium pseudopelargi]AZA09671.1 hypothetical protein CPPEL_07815 [Corynebacterium pseudopelargi]
MPRKQRRRTTRTCPEAYDRNADEVQFPSSADAQRVVELDAEAPELSESQFWKEQMPPHYGGES